MHRLWIQIFIFSQIATPLILGESFYSIIAPGTIRSNRKYSVGVTLHEANGPATIRIAITSPTSSLNLSQDVTLQPQESKLIDFMAPRLLSQFNYELQAEGIRGIELKKKQSLYAVTDGGPRIYTESDRGTYKPGDTVQFRVIILDEHLRPMKIVEPIRVQILDADKNRVKQFKDIQLKRGVFTASFPLSQQPVLGKWTISIYISGRYSMESIYNFEVDKYVLPKFSVHVEAEPYFVEKYNPVIKATVYAKYTYGEYVEGTAELCLLDASHRLPEEAPKQTVAITNGSIKADVFLEIGDHLVNPYKIVIFAKFKENLTNITATGELTVTRKYDRYNIIVPETEIKFRNGKPHNLKVQVQHLNGTAVKDTTKEVSLNLQKNKYKTFMNQNGVAEFEFEYEPTSDFWISYDEATHKMSNIFAPRKSYDYELQTCTIEMKGLSSTDFKNPFEFEIISNDAIPYLLYALISHGNILKEEYIQLPRDQKTHKIKFNMSIELIPKSYLFVHYIVNGKLRYCEFQIHLPQKFENEITLLAPTSVKPGQEITLDIKGQPNSYVSIVAVDKSSLLLNSKNVLKKSTIMEDLSYDRSYVQSRGWIYYPGYVSGLITLTNAKFDMRETYPYQEPTPQHSSEEYPRSIFPETWIFEDIDLDGSSASLKLKVPDTITTWIVRAFSVNDHSGFGMMDATLDIRAFQPFFISTNLPYAVKRGEIVTLPIIIFNYLEQNYDTEIILDNAKEEFTIMDGSNATTSRLKDTRFLNIPAKNGKSVAFVIKPKKVGDIELRISAKNQETSDTIVQKLKVEPEGIKKQYNQDSTLNIRQGKSQKAIFYAQIPPDIVDESEYVTLSVSGDILVSTLENLEDLVMKPYGCGEQNMINLAPNILVLDYLKALNKFQNFTKLVAKAKQHIDTGYQQELTYRHQEGAYSVFGPGGGRTESNWLTAYVARFFIKGIKYSAIEPRIIESGLEFLAKQQVANGSFPQRGYLFHPSHQSEYGFTAFVLLAYLEDPKYSKKFANVIENGMQFLTGNLNSIQDAYSLAIVANVFQATANTNTNEILKRLKKLAIEENGLMWWTQKSSNKNKDNANSVEITSYALMALLETSAHQSAIFNWLIKQRNSHGGFGSTQDTVVGLQALIKYAEKSPHASTDETQLKLSYVAKDASGINVKENFLEVDTENQFVLQQQELPRQTRSVDVEIMGQGKIFLQFTYQYYVTTDRREAPRRQKVPAVAFMDRGFEQSPGVPSTLSLVAEYQFFSIKPIAKLSPNSKSLTLAVCYSYQPLDPTESLTNMVILQVQLPSSFVSNNENIQQLMDEEQISRVELLNSSTVLAIYFEKLEANNEQCLTIMADKMHEVSSLKPAIIEMYDYYNPNERGEVLYEISK